MMKARNTSRAVVLARHASTFQCAINNRFVTWTLGSAFTIRYLCCFSQLCRSSRNVVCGRRKMAQQVGQGKHCCSAPKYAFRSPAALLLNTRCYLQQQQPTLEPAVVP